MEKLTKAQKKFLDKYEIKNADPSHILSPQQVKLLRQNEIKPDQTSFLGNVGRGFVNPIVNLLNVMPPELISQYAINPLLKKAGISHQIPKIPQIPGGNPDSTAYTLGQIGSSLIPYAGIEGLVGRGAEMLPGIAGRIAAKSIPKSAVAGATTGGLLASPNQREQGVLGGLIAAPLGNIAGQAIGRPLKAAVQTPAFEKLSQLLMPSLGAVDSPLVKTAKAIASNYKNLRNISDQNYEDVFGQLEGHKMGMEDLPNYQKTYEDIIDKTGLNKKVTPEMLQKKMGGHTISGIAGKIKKGLTPNEINGLRSDIMKYERDASRNNNSDLEENYQNLASALHQDLENYMKNESPELYPYYREAQNFYKTRIVPFKEHKGAKQILNLLDQTDNLEGPNGINLLDKSGRELSSSPYIPAEGSDDMSKLESLATLLQSPTGMPNREKAAELSKGLIFKKAAPDKSDQFDIDKYLKRYTKLSQSQKDFVFSPEEQNQLNALKDYKTSQGKGAKLTKSLGKLSAALAGGAAAGEMIGSHFGAPGATAPLIGMMAGALGNVPASAAASEAIGTALPSSTKALMRLLQPYQSGILSQQLLPGLLVGGSTAMTQGNKNA